LHSERVISTLRAELERAHADYSRSEKAGKSAEMELSLFKAQHEQTVTHLQRQLDALRPNPKQDELIAELQERIQGMDSLMRSKTQEIEENDDRFIEYISIPLFPNWWIVIMVLCSDFSVKRRS
jgi:hypothetical protein